MEHDLAEIERLLTRFGRYADCGDGAELSRLFVEDGVLTVNSKSVQGAAAIAKFVTDRAADPEQKTRHLWSNLLVEKDDGVTLTTSFLQTTFEQKGTGNSAQVRVSDVVDSFRKDVEGRWRFVSRTIVRQMNVGA